MNTKIPQKLLDIAEQLNTQDNLGTSEPIFLVEEIVRIYGFDGNNDHKHVWLVNDEECSAEENAQIDRIVDSYLDEFTWPHDDGAHYVKVRYKERWNFVTACFTRQAAEDYIKANKHNLHSPRVYVASGNRNEEWIFVRNWLMGLVAAEPE